MKPNPLTRFGPNDDKGNPLTFGGLASGFNVVLPQNTLPTSPQWSKFYGTGRYGRQPDGVDKLQGVNNWSYINSALKAPAPTWNFGRADKSVVPLPTNPISDYVCRLLSYGTDWQHFSSTHWGGFTNHGCGHRQPFPQDYISLEMIHNNLHVS